ncbi:hypothetical protein [Actinomadura sp. B10D3]|uniref:hypothetical protein n=1 Tax=Actinomadura sp. B10D3 TaxID=3153557 RepID=UPI00325D6133
MTSTPNPPCGRRRGPGVFIPQHAIATAVCLLLGVTVAALVWLAPAVWLPVSAGIAATGLALKLHNHWRGRHRA